MKIVIVKYLPLLAALGLSVYVLLIKNAFTWNMLYLVSGLSLLYALLSFIEHVSASKKPKPEKRMFVYFTQGMVTKKAIRIGGFMIASGILLFSGLKVMLFGVMLLAMLIGDMAGLIIRLKHRMYYLYFEEKSIVFVEDHIKKIFASHIKEIEYRYEIFYLTLKNNQVRLIETARLEGEEDRKALIKEFVFWATTYQLPFTAEAKQKLGIE